MADDPVDCLGFFDKREDSHPAPTGRIEEGIHLLDLADHLCPAFGRHINWVVFYDVGMKKICPSLTHLSPMSIGVKAVVTDQVKAVVTDQLIEIFLDVTFTKSITFPVAGEYTVCCHCIDETKKESVHQQWQILVAD